MLGLSVLAVASVLYLFSSITLRAAWSVADVTFSAFAILICSLLIYLAVGSSPQAESIEVTERGLRLTYPSGRVHSMDWSGADLKLVLQQTDSVSGVRRYGRPMWVLLGSRPFQTYLTEDAFSEITRQAQAQGLKVEQRPAPRAGWTRWVIQG